jgi:hypothetical protein
MRYGVLLFAAAAVSLVLMTGTSSAACNDRCQELCRQHPGPQSVENCIKLWSCINEKHRGTAALYINQPPPPECKHLFKPER